jgi:hypothetical protein
VNEVNLSAPHQFAFDFRPDTISNGMRYILFDRIGDAAYGASSKNTWEVIGTSQGWAFCNGNGQGSPNTQTSYVLVNSTITSLVAGRTYHFVINVTPATKTWTATVTDGITDYSSPTLGFRANSTTDGEFVEFGANNYAAQLGTKFTFSLDSLLITNTISNALSYNSPGLPTTTKFVMNGDSILPGEFAFSSLGTAEGLEFDLSHRGKSNLAATN